MFPFCANHKRGEDLIFFKLFNANAQNFQLQNIQRKCSKVQLQIYNANAQKCNFKLYYFIMTFFHFLKKTKFDIFYGIESLGELFDWKTLFENFWYWFCFSVPKSDRKRPTYLFHIRNKYPLLKSNIVKYCQIMSNNGHLGTFLVIFEHYYMFFALFNINK